MVAILKFKCIFYNCVWQYHDKQQGIELNYVTNNYACMF